jgi:hypothetical protein
MPNALPEHLSEPVSVFRTQRLPAPARLAGYSALIEAFDLEVPLPRRFHGIGARHKVEERGGWRLLTPRHAPDNTLGGQLSFALKWEGVDLGVMKRLFQQVGPGPVVELVRDQPTGRYARRIWFFYEWLLQARVDLPDASTAINYTDALAPKLQFAGRAEPSPRHRVRNNLPGTPQFCPLVTRSPALTAFLKGELAAQARRAAARVSADVLARAAAFLLLADSRSSFAIEGEQPSPTRIARWGQAIGQAGRTPLDLDEFLRLQRVVIGDARFVRLGLRDHGGFVGEHDRATGLPLPEHISARPEDLADLMDGLLAFESGPGRTLDPVIAAACLAFGFVYIHPFADGNGRIHRYLIHHVLAERGFNPPGLVFPVSAVILREIDAYRAVLQSHARAVLPLIHWKPTEDRNVHVINDTGDYYRFFDATPHAEFLFHCVQETVSRDLPQETRFLEAYDRFAKRIQEIVDMPAGTVDLLFRLLRQNGGALSARARHGEFAALEPDEVRRAEAIYTEEFEDEDQLTGNAGPT